MLEKRAVGGRRHQQVDGRGSAMSEEFLGGRRRSPSFCGDPGLAARQNLKHLISTHPLCIFHNGASDDIDEVWLACVRPCSCY